MCGTPRKGGCQASQSLAKTAGVKAFPRCLKTAFFLSPGDLIELERAAGEEAWQPGPQVVEVEATAGPLPFQAGCFVVPC